MLGNFFQRLKHTDALKGYRLNNGLIFLAEFRGEQINRQNVREIAFVQLQHVRNLVEVVPVLSEIRHQVLEGLDVRVHALLLRVGHEHDPIHAAQNQFAAGIVENLSWNGVKVNASLESAHRPKIQREKIEEQRTLSLSGQRDHFALLLVRRLLINHLQIRRLAAEPGAIVHDLAIDFPGCEVDETQRLSSKAATPSRDAACTTVPFRRLAVFISYGGYRPQVTHVTPLPNPPQIAEPRAPKNDLSGRRDRIITGLGVDVQIRPMAKHPNLNIAVCRTGSDRLRNVTERVLVARLGGDLRIRLFDRVP